MKFFIIGIFLSGLVFSQTKGDCFQCGPPNPEWGITKVTEWAEKMDILGNVAMRTGYMKTSFGNPVHESCYKDLTPEEWNVRLRRMEAGISYAITQAHRCWGTLGLGGGSGIITKLRRAKLHCGKDVKVAAFASWGIFTAPSYSHNYNLHDWGPYMDNATMESVGSTLFHEVSHWSVANNRSWHNHSHNRKRLGCDKSIFEDRIYMMEAACFPQSDVGKKFYNETDGASNCSDVCYKSLTESDSDTLHWAHRIFQGASHTLYGHKVKPDQAKHICDRIKKVPANYKASVKKLESMKKRNKKLKIWAYGHLGKSKSGSHMQELLKKALKTAEQAYDAGKNLEATNKLFKKQKEKFTKEISRVCTGQKPSSLLSFCGNHIPVKNPITEELDRIEQQIMKVKVSDFNLYTPAPSVP